MASKCDITTIVICSMLKVNAIFMRTPFEMTHESVNAVSFRSPENCRKHSKYTKIQHLTPNILRNEIRK